MESSKQHSLYRIIQSMDSTEKAYFKKFAFKRENKNNDSYHTIFKLVDKQNDFDISEITKNQNISDNHRANIHATLNKLFKIICQVLVEYRKDKSANNKLFGLLDEYELLREKKLFDLAEKKYLQIETLVEERKMYYFKPYVYQIRGSQLQNNILSKPSELKNYFIKLDQSRIDLDINIEVAKIGLKIEELFHKNGGVVNKSNASIKDADELISIIDDAIALSESNFLFTSVLANNRFVVQMMFGRMANFEGYFEEYIAYFDINIKQKLKDTELHDILITLKNYAVVSIYLDLQSLFEKANKRLGIIYDLLGHKEYKEKLKFRLLNLTTLNFALNENQELDQEVLDETSKLMKTFFGKAQYSEALLSCMMAYIKKKQFDVALSISDSFIREHHNDRIRDQYISIRIVRAIAWYKKDAFELFQSEITSVYKKLISIENFPFQLHICQMLKRLNHSSLKSSNNELISKLIEECSQILENETGSKKMKAVEMRAIALLALQ